MARPRKCRRVCRVPDQTRFGPMSNGGRNEHILKMSIEEYETIRLIDHENLTQEECALQMKIARTTVQKIYNDARSKIAATLVDGVTLMIDGGDYQLCNGNNQYCHNDNCQKRIKENRGNDDE